MKLTTKIEYGTQLQYVGKNNELCTEEFWGKNHSDAAIEKLNIMSGQRKMYWHTFIPLQRNG